MRDGEMMLCRLFQKRNSKDAELHLDGKERRCMKSGQTANLPLMPEYHIFWL